MSNFMGVGVFWIGLNRADLGCWRLTLRRILEFYVKAYCQIQWMSGVFCLYCNLFHLD